jgi:hypothetical protein
MAGSCMTQAKFPVSFRDKSVISLFPFPGVILIAPRHKPRTDSHERIVQ